MNQNPLMISYKNLRILIGVLAISIAIGCVLGGLLFAALTPQISISAYYHTNMRDYLEAILMGTGMFMLMYYGYDLKDRIISSVAGFFGICIALFPTYGNQLPVGIFQLDPHLSEKLHMGSAIIFFALLAYISYFLFTKSGPTMTIQKKTRNVIYRVCGIVIVVSGILLALCNLLLPYEIIARFRLILVFEFIMLTAFGISWLTKGEAIFGDNKVNCPCLKARA